MNFVSLLANETRLLYYETKQYWFESISGLILITAMFSGLFFGVKSYTGDGSGDMSLDGLVFGFFLWTFASGAYGSVGNSVADDNQKGLLEQLFLCPMGIRPLIFARAMVEMVWGIFMLSVIALITMTITGNWLDLNFPYLYLLLFIASIGVIGVGFIISGLTLIYKKVASVSMLVSIGLMGLVAVEALPFNVFALLPYAAGASLARDVILQGEPLNWLHLGIVVANSLVYFLIGLFIFRKMELKAKRLNLIGQY